jgi:hypothetical protein
VGCGVVEDVVGCGLGCCTQLASFVLPSVAEDLPATQSKQLLAPGAAEYLPATQSKQLLAPGAAEYLPAVQSVHAPTTVHSAEKPSYSKK